MHLGCDSVDFLKTSPDECIRGYMIRAVAVIWSLNFRRNVLRFLDRMQPLALLAMRLTLSVIMVAHGSQKVFGGLHQFANTVHGMGLPSWLAYVAAFTEFICGLMILVGFFTRAAAFAVCIDLIVAIWKVPSA